MMFHRVPFNVSHVKYKLDILFTCILIVFLSGVDKPNSNLDGHIPYSPHQQLLTSSTGDKEPRSPPSLAHDPCNEVLPFRTPRKLSKIRHPSSFFNGLDSCAGAKLLMSPAITRCSKIKRASVQSDLTSVRVSSDYIIGIVHHVC